MFYPSLVYSVLAHRLIGGVTWFDELDDTDRKSFV